jgi:hypothetical protein
LSRVALCGALSLLVQVIPTPTLAATGCGANLKSLIVTVTVPVAPAGAAAHAAPPAPPDAAAWDAAGWEAAA